MSKSPNTEPLRVRNRSGREFRIDVPAGVYNVEPRGRLTYANDAFRRIFGFPEKEKSVEGLYSNLEKTNKEVARIAAKADPSAEERLLGLLAEQNRLTGVIIQKLKASEILARLSLVVALIMLALTILSKLDYLEILLYAVIGLLR